MLMRQNVLWMSHVIAWRIEIKNFKIPSLLGLINAEIEVLLRGDFGVFTCRQLLNFKLVFELKLGNLFMNDLVNFLFNRF